MVVARGVVVAKRAMRGEEQTTTGSQDAPTFGEIFCGLRHVLEDLGGQDEIVVGDADRKM